MSALVNVVDLVKHYSSGGFLSRARPPVRAVDGVSFAIAPGETLGLVGESGSGKSTIGRNVLRLEEPTSGKVEFEGTDLATVPPAALRSMRRRMQIIFQDPLASLNPRRTIGASVAEGLEIHRLVPRSEIVGRVAELLQEVGLDPAYAARYPHEFSGGQRQRIGVARALALNPRLIVADEPVSALDVSIQAQVVNLLDDLQEELGLTYVFIAHDLGVVRHVSDRIAVMYLGVIVEQAPADILYERPIHPYTEALLSAIPLVDTDESAPPPRGRIVLEGEVPSPIDPPTGCRFHPRCRYATDICRTERPPLIAFGGGRFAACHHPLGGATPLASPPLPAHTDDEGRVR